MDTARQDDQEPGPFTPHTVCVVGGKGRMGAWLTRCFQKAGYDVVVADAGHDLVEKGLLAICPVIVLAVPIPEVERVMYAIGPHTRPDGVVIDITSLKQGPVASMLEHARGEVIGTHPLFGPSAPSLQDQVVFVCPARGRSWVAWLEGFLRKGGAKVVRIEPQRHDRLMAQVQTLRHLMLVCWGRTLLQSGFEPDKDLERSGPWFQTLMDLLTRQMEQPPELYADLALHNPAGAQAMEALSHNVQEMARCLASGDRDALTAMIDEAGALVGAGKERLKA